MTSRRSLLAASAAGLLRAHSEATKLKYQIGAYYFPNYHPDPRNKIVHGAGWTEWELVKRAEPRFPGHRQPRVPAWGYEDESDPKVFARKIDAAAGHGINHFIFDWYWYDDGPFLERGLEQGYLGAANNSRVKFCLMWANHNWVDIMPAKRKIKPTQLYPGAVTRATFDKLTEHAITRYFKHPSYWCIDGCPYFSIYDLRAFVDGLGGTANALAALRDFRRRTRQAGFRDLHLNSVFWGVRILPGEKQLTNPREILAALEFDSSTSYVWVHHVQMKDFPETSYKWMAAESYRYWHKAVADTGKPYYPNVTMGWDPSPRTVASDAYTNDGYPFTPTLAGNTPQAFREALVELKKFLDAQPPERRIANINAWNEWTEGSYLEPDTVHGLGYLKAIRDEFGF